MSSHLAWGVIGCARIATQKVIPAIQRSRLGRVVAIGSRDLTRAREAAAQLEIESAFGSYEAVLKDPRVQAVYIPLPNHLHVEWATRAAEAGKHVLCEKPVALSAARASELLTVRDRTGVLVQEAFMIRAHPQWEAAIAAVRGGRIGAVRLVNVVFSYRNLDPLNIRNIEAFGGGGLMDIGCYIVHAARWIFGAEPVRASAAIDRDPASRIDRLTSVLLDFGGGRHAVGACATQVAPYQRVHIVGERGRIEIEIPFNAPPDRRCRIWIDDGRDLNGTTRETIEFPPTDQYTVQADRFAEAIASGGPAPLPLEDAVANMRVIDTLRA